MTKSSINTARLFLLFMGVFCLVFISTQIEAMSQDRGESVSVSASHALQIIPQQHLDLQYFARIPVLHEGRIKPMDSFARSSIHYLSGNERHALPILVQILMNPSAGENIPLIRVSDPEIRKVLGLNNTNRVNKPRKLHSYRQLSIALQAHQDALLSIVKVPQDQWTPSQKHLVQVQEKMVYLGQLLASLSLFQPLSVQLPVSDEVPAAWRGYQGRVLTYMDVLKFRKSLEDNLRDIAQKQGSDVATYTPLQQSMALLSFTTAQLQQLGARSHIFRVIPAADNQGAGGDAAPLLSPWQMVLSGQGDIQNRDIFMLWRDMVRAYHDGNALIWEGLSQDILEKAQAHAQLQNGARLGAQLNVEYYYNALAPFTMGLASYAICLVFLGCASYIRSWLEKPARYIDIGAHILLWVGFLVGVIGIIGRMYILDRPPVSTLYESVLFVGIIAVGYCLLGYRQGCSPTRHPAHHNALSRQLNAQIWLWVGAGLGVVLSLLAVTNNRQGDDLLMLTAVLNTNFWLATHVTCITIGYAFCLVTSVLAHIELATMVFGAIRQNKHNKQKARTSIISWQQIHQAALLALFFSTIGTVLGGIWADQSWGRFWGWDPKENGALLIILWLVWVLHGRVSGQMRSQAVILAGLAYLSVIVALSWFGVNLLSVGLHSYGFSDGAVAFLTIFILLQTSILGLAIYLLRANEAAPRRGDVNREA